MDSAVRSQKNVWRLVGPGRSLGLAPGQELAMQAGLRDRGYHAVRSGEASATVLDLSQTLLTRALLRS